MRSKSLWRSRSQRLLPPLHTHTPPSPQIESKGGRPLAQLRVSSPGLVQASHAFRVRLPGASVLLRLVAGAHADGRPVFGVAIDDVSPPPLVAAAAAAALAAGKTVAGAKGMPLATLRVPGLDVPWTVGVSRGGEVGGAARARARARRSTGRRSPSRPQPQPEPSPPCLPPPAEIRASVQKRGKGVAADLRELNFVLDV